MRDTNYERMQQKMVLDDSTPKGLRIVLEERGVNTTGMLKRDLVSKLEAHHDSASELSTVKHFLISRGHYCPSSNVN